MLKPLKTLGVVAVLLLLVLAAGYGWAHSAANAQLARSLSAHDTDVPVPYPLEEADLEELRRQRGAEAPEGEDPLAGVDLQAVALERAVARGKHLVESRFVCVECHGSDFRGGVMVDDPAVGTLLGPNLTAGRGSRTLGYTFADWDRIVRHGIRRDGRPAVMPSDDFLKMSDRELSDIIAYIQTFPPVDNEVPEPRLGPLGTVFLALGKLPLSADAVEDHHRDHPRLPPDEEVSEEFGAHLAQVCVGCHRHKLEGGPIPVGPPDWAPAANLTPHADGLAGWRFEQFDQVMRTGRRPDGTMVKEPMTLVRPYASNMTDVEMRALWAYLQSSPPVPLGK
jgi:mono/diheme cytochrome c family protein